jgi:DNA-directed RNA polymerase specialized sigma24 family protein
LDYVKAQNRKKRAGHAEHVPLAEADALADEMSFELLALDLALQKLARQDLRKSRMIEMQTFGGCTVEEIAEFFGVSKSTIERELRLAMAWLRRELGAIPGAVRTDVS